MDKHGFTLIELLIVVLIIAILAAIAVPNFLEFQVRAKVSRVKSDMRILATGLEAYAVDNDDYPYQIEIPGTYNGINYPYVGAEEALRSITTPISYVTSLPADPFMVASEEILYGGYSRYTYVYINAEMFEVIWSGSWWEKAGLDAEWTRWLLKSHGPDQIQNWTTGAPQYTQYDSSNGTMSNGDIIRTGP